MEFLDEFNKLTNGKFEYMRIAKVNVQKKPPVVAVNFLAPCEVIDKFLTAEDKEEITKAVVEILPKSFDVQVTFVKSYASEEVVKKYLFNFFAEKHPTVLIDSSEIKVQIANEVVYIELSLKSTFYDYFKSVDLENNIKNYLSHKICNQVNIKIEDNKKKIDVDSDLATEEGITVVSRRIRTSEHEKVVGKDILARAKYIVDKRDVEENAVYAGEVVEFKRSESKKTGNSYYVFKLNDSTGNLTCKAFTKYQGEGVFDQIEIGDEVIVQGKVDVDTFLHDSVLLVRDVSKCKIDKASIILKEELKPVPLKYVAVKPEPYVDFVQEDLFSTGTEKEVIPFLQGKTFVIFDFETTGVDVSDEVTELGAVKMVNGVITETLNTFVNPHRPIPPNIVKLTSITDDDVKDAPDMSDVIADFYKFSENAILVGQNVAFDKMFVDKYAKQNGYVFTNRTMDTLAMARKSIVTQSYKLGSLCDYFGITLEGAHRAVNDCLATAKLFVELVKLGKF